MGERKEMSHLKVLPFTGVTTGKVLVDDVLTGALGQLTEVVVIGYDENQEIYVAASHGPADVVWAIEEAKTWLMTRGDDGNS